MTRKRLKPEHRREEILTAALELSRSEGYHRVTREQIAKRADVAEGLVSHYFGTMVQMRRAIMRAAIAARDLVVLAQGLGLGDPNAKKAPEEMRRSAAGQMV